MRTAAVTLTAIVSAALLTACAGTDKPAAQAAADPQPGSLAYDQSVWHSLLADHESIRRDVRPIEDGLEAVTESDDPGVSAKIQDHALAMQRRMKSGSRVRQWDPVFVALFDHHDKVKLDVTTTAKGVRIVETSDDPEVAALLRAHAAGVSDFVREGFDAASRETPMPPPGATGAMPTHPLVTLPGVPHRFDRTQPDAAAIAEFRSEGVTTVVDFRHAKERPDFNEAAAVEKAGLAYVNIPYAGAPELTDEVFDKARETLKSLNTPAVMHCRSGNRVGAVWLSFRVLDGGVTWDQALAEAKQVGLKDPQLEGKAKDYIARRTAR